MDGPLVAILGPTGVGKTSLALNLARTLGGIEIVSADSRQIYRGLNIGTAKPSPREVEGVPYHLVDVVDPDETFTVHDFKVLAERTISEIHSRGNLPVVVGGTLLYVKALIDGLSPMPERNPEVEADLRREAEALGAERLWERLRCVDPFTASRVHPRDLFRITRALGIYLTTGKPISAWRGNRRRVPYRPLQIVLNRPREELYRRIDARVDDMVASGLVDEVRALVEMGYGGSEAMRGVGYKEILSYIYGKSDLNSCIQLVKRNTRRYAKRQLSWLRQMGETIWVDLEAGEARAVREILGIIDNFISGGEIPPQREEGALAM
ncbi:MAG: tRNA (adenosine(37)-N6)-dimethylallyltransferase MiaA [bacterium]